MNTAAALTRRLGGRWTGVSGQVSCPVCQPERRKDQRALSITVNQYSGLVLLNCHKSNCDFHDILAAAHMDPAEMSTPDMADVVLAAKKHAEEMASRSAAAERIWGEARHIGGTMVSRYLRGRGITAQLPDTLRYHPSLKHGPSGQYFPAMVARVDGGDGFAIHRTYLSVDGEGKADVAPAKMALGPIRGGAVRLGGNSRTLVVSEGIETGLSMFCGFFDEPVNVWAGLSASGMEALRLPRGIEKLIIARDNDKAGQAAALALAGRAWRSGAAPLDGISIVAPDGDASDFNDIIWAKGVRK